MDNSERARTILAVDDERLILSLVKSSLEKHGFSVLTAPDGKQALDIFNTVVQQIDLVITDIVMPEMDGTVLAERILDLRPDLPVLFISGYSERLERINAPVLAKPFSSGALVGKVRSLLGVGRQSAGC